MRSWLWIGLAGLTLCLSACESDPVPTSTAAAKSFDTAPQPPRTFTRHTP